MMKRGSTVWLKTAATALSLALGGCTLMPPIAADPGDRAPAAPLAAPETAAAHSEARSPVTILVSLDGFRPDYLARGVTPNLSRLAAGGVSAAMRPSFPSITFPNHWTLVTGKVPDHHGVVGNTMEDPTRPGETFTMATDDPFWWSGGEPIWVSAERAGIRTATMFWPGANVAWGSTEKGAHGVWKGGVRPEDWQQFNQAVTGAQRVDAVVDWMRRPAATRPRFVTLYFDTVDSAGHAAGPDSPEVTQAVADVDAQIGRLVEGLAALGQPANLVIVADHGMAGTSPNREIALDQIDDPADYRVIEGGAFASIAPVPGHEAKLEAALLRPHPHMQCWRKGQIPARFRFGTNPRVEPYFCLAEVGWRVDKTMPKDPHPGGTHGYDNDAPAMRALFIANGPSFARGRRLPTFDNVDVAPLLRDLLGLPAGQGLDGTDAPFRAVLRR